jgi:hypothetical protein
VTDQQSDPALFAAHIELLSSFLIQRESIVGRIEGVLNAQRKPLRYLQDRGLLSRLLEDCFFAPAAVDAGQARLRRQLEQAHWTNGFRPRQVAGLHNDLIDPAEMLVRGFHCWQQTRWPGRSGRARYAETLFNVHLVRNLELLSMRLWDAGSSGAGERLVQVQHVLDELWKSSPGDQPVLVRDARWLIPLTLSPTTDELAAYFDVVRNVAETPAGADRIEICKAAVAMLGGHLRSQIRHYCLQDGSSIDEQSVVLRTRTSNALDVALLIQYLVPLLEAYEDAWRDGDDQIRCELADAICQGICPDPDLFVNRLDLLGPYSMIEYLFVSTSPEGGTAYTPAGKRHVQLLQEFEALIGRLATPLYDDCLQFRPRDGAYSPYGAIFGTPSNLTEHMALKALQRDAGTRFSVEDVFTAGGSDKLDWVNGWRQLPHIDPQVQRLHAFPQDFADEIFARIERALHRHIENAEAGGVQHSGQLFVLAEAGPQPDSGSVFRSASRSVSVSTSRSDLASVPDLSPAFFVSSDRELVAGNRARACDRLRLLRDRLEGHFILSYQSAGGWVAIRKDFLTQVLEAGNDVKIVGLPAAAADVLSLMFPARPDAPA